MSLASAIRPSRAGGVRLAGAFLMLLAAPGGSASAAALAPAVGAAVSPRAARPLRPPHRVLARIAAAVDGAESDYGTNPAMWRADPLGPQGPMQVSAAAAADVGGGNRFDPGENLALGRAYLDLMYHRYGSWAEAVAAYNWGPARMDAWIRSGRPAAQLPAAVARYTGRVLFASFSPGARFLPMPDLPALMFARRRPGLLRARGRRVRPVNPRDPVQQLYRQVMRASADAARRP